MHSINALVYILAFTGAVCFVVGDVCISNYEHISDCETRPDSIESCQKLITPGFVLVLIARIIIFVAQYYSFALIAIVARQNSQRIRKTICTQICYVLVFISQNFIVIYLFLD